MKSLLVTGVITTFVLALFLHSGNALVCYNCDVPNCTKNVTCTGDQDSCIIVYQGARNTSRCWKYSNCNINFISQTFGINNFRYKCCQWNLCNSASNVVTSKVVLSGAFLLTIVHMLKSLVWN